MKVHPLLLLIGLNYAIGQDRQIISKLNPGCDHCDYTKNPLIYIRAEGYNDTVHQLWDFTNHLPAMVYAIGSPNSTLTVLWNKDQPNKFMFSEQPMLYSFAATIDSIIEYNDLKDNGHYDTNCKKKIWSLDHLSWRLADSVLTDKEAMVKLQGEEDRNTGVLEMKLDLLPFKDYAIDLPHLVHTANSTLVDIRVVNHTTHHGFNSSRFALHFVLISTDPSTDTWSMAMRKSLDDEHTPGVFEIIEIKSPETSRSGNGGFMQFRPVAYTEPERGVSSSTNAYISSFNRTNVPSSSILRNFYKGYFQDRKQEVVVQDMVISFGLAGDGFYRQHNFTSWSFTLGYGMPPLEGFSLFVIIIITIGMGVPVILALSGILYVVVRRCKQRNPPARFTNDES